MTGHDLVTKLLATIDPSSREEFFAMKNLLGMAIGGCPVDGTLPESVDARHAFHAAQRCLFEMRKATRPSMRTDGIIWQGRPPFLTESLLSYLEAELLSTRTRATRQKWRQCLHEGGPAVRAFAKSKDLRAFVEEFVGPTLGVGEPTCLYYDEEGAFVKPHIDTDTYCINANLLLSHSWQEQPTSWLYVYPVQGEPLRVRQEPGHLVLMYADCIVHGRTPTSQGETVLSVAVGFQPQGEIHASADRPEA